MTDFPLKADVVLLNSGETARKGMYVEFGLHHELDGPICPGDRNPFMDMSQGREKGQRFRVTFHLLADDETSTEIAEEGAGDKTEQPAERTTDGWSEAKRKMVQKSGILRKSYEFRDWLGNEYDDLWQFHCRSDKSSYQIASDALHSLCRITSFTDIDPEGSSGMIFKDIASRYEAFQSGQTPEAQQTQLEDGPS